MIKRIQTRNSLQTKHFVTSCFFMLNSKKAVNYENLKSAECRWNMMNFLIKLNQFLTCFLFSTSRFLPFYCTFPKTKEKILFFYFVKFYQHSSSRSRMQMQVRFMFFWPVRNGPKNKKWYFQEERRGRREKKTDNPPIGLPWRVTRGLERESGVT